MSHIFHHIYTKSPVALNIGTETTLQDSLVKSGYYVPGSKNKLYHLKYWSNLIELVVTEHTSLYIPHSPSLSCPLSHPISSQLKLISRHFSFYPSCGHSCPLVLVAPSIHSFPSFKAQSILLFFSLWILLMWFNLCLYLWLLDLYLSAVCMDAYVGVLVFSLIVISLACSELYSPLVNVSWSTPIAPFLSLFLSPSPCSVTLSLCSLKSQWTQRHIYFALTMVISLIWSSK